MSDPVSSDNRSTLAALSAFLSFPYIWLGLFLALSLMYGGNFFGQDLGGSLVAALLCLGLLNPIVPGMIANFVARPIFLNLLAREIVSTAGCLTGLAGFLTTGLTVLYFLGRDLETALIIFLAAPVVGGLLATAISALGRVGIFSETSGPRTPSSGPRIRIEKPTPRQLPDRGKPQQLPSSRRTPSRVPAPRRGERSKPGNRQVPPPRRRE